MRSWLPHQQGEIADGGRQAVLLGGAAAEVHAVHRVDQDGELDQIRRVEPEVVAQMTLRGDRARNACELLDRGNDFVLVGHHAAPRILSKCFLPVRRKNAATCACELASRTDSSASMNRWFWMR